MKLFRIPIERFFAKVSEFWLGSPNLETLGLVLNQKRLLNTTHLQMIYSTAHVPVLSIANRFGNGNSYVEPGPFEHNWEIFIKRPCIYVEQKLPF
jgi:hypothetical protein